MGSALILLNGGFGMSVGVLSFVKLKERGVSVRFYFSFFPSGGVRVLFACLSSGLVRRDQRGMRLHSRAPFSFKRIKKKN